MAPTSLGQSSLLRWSPLHQGYRLHLSGLHKCTYLSLHSKPSKPGSPQILIRRLFKVNLRHSREHGMLIRICHATGSTLDKVRKVGWGENKDNAQIRLLIYCATVDLLDFWQATEPALVWVEYWHQDNANIMQTLKLSTCEYAFRNTSEYKFLILTLQFGNL